MDEQPETQWEPCRWQRSPLLVHLGFCNISEVFLMILCRHFRSQWGSQTKPTKSAHVLQRNYANEGKTTKKNLIMTLHSPEPQIKNSFIC